VNNFILSYNSWGAFPKESQLLNHVQYNRLIKSYYQPFLGTFLLKSAESAHSLNESLKGFFDEWPYTLIQFDSRFASGSLPTHVWEWINTGVVPPLPPPPPRPVPSAVVQALIDAGIKR
jgi:hypothetical protein